MSGKPKRRKKIPTEHYDTVSAMLMNVVPTPMILTQLSMRWGKAKKYVSDVIVRVHEDWATQAALTADTRRHQIRAGFEQLLTKAMRPTNPNAPQAQQVGDLRLAAHIMRELGLLDGCYKPTGVDINVSGQVGVGIALGALGFKSQDEVKDRIAELQKKLAIQGPSAISVPPSQNHAQATNLLTTPSAAVSAFEDDDETS